MKTLLPLSAITTALLLAACSSDDSNKQHISNSSGLIFYNAAEESFIASPVDDSNIDQAVHIMTDEGISAAIVSSGTVHFVSAEWHEDEEHWHTPELLTLNKPGSTVTAVNGHFSVLDSATNSSYLLEAHDMADADDNSFEIINNSLVQTFPAILMSEDEYGFRILFGDGKAKVYKQIDDELAQETNSSDEPREVDCASPSGPVANGDNLVVNCGNGSAALLNIHGDHAHTYTISFGEFSNSNGYQWLAGHEGLLAGYSNSAIIKLDSSTAEAFTDEEFDGNICYAGFEVNTQETLFVITDAAKVYVLDEDGASLQNALTLDETPATTGCDQLVISAGSNQLFVADNSIKKLYLIDSHDGADYHIHERLSYDKTLERMIVLQLAGEAHDHDHEHNEEAEEAE